MSIDAFGQAERFVTSGDYGSAKSEYERIISSESDNSAAWYGLGVVNHAVGDVEAAIVAFERAFLINRFHEPTLIYLIMLSYFVALTIALKLVQMSLISGCDYLAK